MDLRSPKKTKMMSAHTTAGDHDSNHRTSSALAEEQYW
jgi:hypothetical protein